MVCNFVGSVDGKATAAGRTAPLSDDGDRAAFMLLRTQVDAVMVGTGTLRVERYGPLINSSELTQVREAEGLAPVAVVDRGQSQWPGPVRDPVVRRPERHARSSTRPAPRRARPAASPGS